MHTINSYTDLKANVDQLSLEELRWFAANVFLSLYGKADNDLNRMTIDPDKEWDSNTIDDVRNDLENLGLQVGDSGDTCSECGNPTDLDGWDGKCGNCADKDVEGEA